jgi:hypothetical protein
MKSKAIISLIMMVAMVLGATIALADTFNADPLTDVTTNGWVTTNGAFTANAGNNGIITDVPDSHSRAAHPVTTDSSGAFNFESTFKVNNASSDVHVGVSSAMNSGDVCVGWLASNQKFAAIKDNSQVLAFIGGDSLDPTATYTGKISSTDGNSFTCSIYKGSELVGSTVVMGFKPAAMALWIENYGVINGPTVYSMKFDSTAPTPSASPSPSPSPSPSDTPKTQFALDLQAIREFYANQPIVHMSNQSVIYNPDGTVKQVITGNETIATPTATPSATAVPNETATPVPAQTTVTPVPSTPAATTSQAPGFEIILATIGMLSALVLITRKKK